MEKKFWWFLKKNEPANDFDEINNDYYGSDMSSNQSASDSAVEDDYNDTGDGDVSVVLSGDPSKKAPLVKKTFSPLTCEDSAEIVDAYKEGKVVVICVEELDKPNFLRLFDYLMGAVQALDGELRRIDRDTVVLLPYDFDDETSVDDIPEENAEESVEENETEEEDITEDDEELN